MFMDTVAKLALNPNKSKLHFLHYTNFVVT